MQNGISYDSSTDGQFFAIYARASVSLKISTRHPPLRSRSSSLPKACVGALCVVMYKMCGVGTDVLGKQSAVVTIGYPLSAFGHRIVLHITAVTTTARNTMYNSRLVSIAGRVLVAIAMSTHPDTGEALGTAGHTATQAEARPATCLFPHNPLELVVGVDSQAGANAQLWFPGLCARREGTASSPTVVPIHPLRVERAASAVVVVKFPDPSG